MIQVIKSKLDEKINYLNSLTAEKDRIMKTLREIDTEITQAIGAANALNQLLQELTAPIGLEETVPQPQGSPEL